MMTLLTWLWRWLLGLGEAGAVTLNLTTITELDNAIPDINLVPGVPGQ